MYSINCFFTIKPNRCTNFPNLLRNETLQVSGSSSARYQEFIHCTLSNVICHTAFEQVQDGTAVPSWSCSKAVYKPVWHTPLLSVQWINSWRWTEELPETCRVSCLTELGKLVRLVGFIIKKFVTIQDHVIVKFMILVFTTTAVYRHIPGTATKNNCDNYKYYCRNS